MSVSIDSLSDSLRACSLEERGQDSSIVYTIPNAHRDDIHGLIPLGNSGVISGSKDGSIGCWTTWGLPRWYLNGPSRIDYRRWVTALSPLDNQLWVSGTREGCVSLWDSAGRQVRTWATDLVQSHQCKERNFSRIMCFAVDDHFEKSPCFFVGQATRFSLFSLQGRRLYCVDTGKNDWVYTLLPLQGRRMLVVTGPTLSMWQTIQHYWQRTHFLIQDNTPMNNGIRPFISSLLPFSDRPSLIAATVFDGSVRTLDIQTGGELQRWQEHEGRVWSVIHCGDRLLASSGDDRCVKIWDLNSKTSVHTIGNHVGRVSSLLTLPPYQFLAATCPSRPTPSEGASLICRDIRKL